jgi:pseudouridine-5'-phosphate glycosidase
MLEQYLDVKPDIETALNIEQTVRGAGAVPATIATSNGRLKVGLLPPVSRERLQRPRCRAVLSAVSDRYRPNRPTDNDTGNRCQ